MKTKTFLATLLIAAGVACVALAAPPASTPQTHNEVNHFNGATDFQRQVNANAGFFSDAGSMVNSTLMVDGGLTVGLQGGPIAAIIPGTETMDFASTTITCVDSTGSTAAGAATNDACVLGMPTTLTGAGTGLHSNFSCYVSAANTVKIRKCAAGTADDPGSVIFKYWVLKF